MSLRARWRQMRIRHWLRRCEHVGISPRITGTPSIFAEVGRLRIGDHFRLASTPVGSHLWLGAGALLEIGDDVSIGCGAAIAAMERVQIGAGTRIGPFVIIMDTNFHSGAGDQSVQHDCLPVTIGRRCRIGSRVTITRGVTIGDDAEVLAGSVVTSAVPAGACVAGVRARVIGPAGDAHSRWDGPAAMLPDLLMASLDLKSPPDLDGTQIPANLWNQARISTLISMLQDRFNLTLDPSGFQHNSTYADIAAAIRNAGRRQ
jgi:acetyltransferase-like isoleucine patch superfamily enzyme